MGRRRYGSVLLLLMVALVTGCVVSTQEGERRTIHSKHPDEISFHFDTGYNKIVVLGRSGLLLALAAWLIFKRTGGPNTGPSMLGIVAVVGALWLAGAGWTRISRYRVDVTRDALHWHVPGADPLDLDWDDIQGLEVEGMARDIGLGIDRGPGAAKWAPEWEDLLIYHTDGRVLDADLRPLSVEQRGTLWRAIARKAEIGLGKPLFVPAGHAGN